MKWKGWYHPFISFIFSSQKSTVWIICAFFVVADIMMLEEPTTRIGLRLLASLITIVVCTCLSYHLQPTYLHSLQQASNPSQHLFGQSKKALFLPTHQSSSSSRPFAVCSLRTPVKLHDVENSITLQKAFIYLDKAKSYCLPSLPYLPTCWRISKRIYFSPVDLE